MSQHVPSLESIITSDHVPTLPEVVLEVLRVAQQPEPSMEDLIRVIRMDPAIAGRIVKFANSPLFGIRKTEQTIEASVVLLGTTMIRTLVLGFSLANKKASAEAIRPHFQQIWRETLFQAVAAEVLGERHKGIDPAVWFLGALIQDAGRLVMLNVFQKEYVERVIRSDSDAPLCDREAQAFGFSHADVSAALCRTWNLGQDVTDAVAQHHSPRTPPSEGDVTLARALVSVNTCNDYIEAVTGHAGVSRDAVEQDLILLHHCRPDEVVEVLADIDSRAQAMAGVLKADVGSMLSRELILERAQEALMEIAVAEQLRRLSGSKVKKSAPV
jgi:HD-like signal output (HDOD) protein